MNPALLVTPASMIFDYVEKMVSAATGKNVVIFLVASLTVYFVMLFVTIPDIQSYAPGMKIFDLSPAGYSYDYSIKLLSSLGDEGRKKYLYIQLPLDLIYPALFSISSFLLLAWLFLKRYENDSSIFYLCFVPVIAGIFDYLENIQIVLMILVYPEISRAQVALSSTATIAKSGLTMIFFLLLIFGFFRCWRGSKN